MPVSVPVPSPVAVSAANMNSGARRNLAADPDGPDLDHRGALGYMREVLHTLT